MLLREHNQVTELFGGKKVLSFILAGGVGSRLLPLTLDRAKPAVPFGGRYRLIDIVLSNFVNSGFYKIVVLTQYKSDSLSRHIRRHWNLSSVIGQYVETVPAQMRVGNDWYKGSAHAIYQNLYLLEDEKPDYVAIFGGDHIYHMDIQQMLDFHISKGADLTVAAISYPRDEASQFGICTVDKDSRMTDFIEKPDDPAPIPGNPDLSLVSMGNYIFNADLLREMVSADAEDPNSVHDFGKNIIPAMTKMGKTFVYDFNSNYIPGNPRIDGVNYWRDIGTLDSYYDCAMDIVSVSPPLNLYNPNWPILAVQRSLPPAKFVFADKKHKRVGCALDSMLAEGCIVSGGSVQNSLLFQNVRVNSYASVKECVLFEGVEVGRHSKLKKVIVDKNVRIPPGTIIGYDAKADKERFPVTEQGIVVVEKGMKIPVNPDFKPELNLLDDDYAPEKDPEVNA